MRLIVPERWGSISVAASFTITEVLSGAILRVTWYPAGIAERISMDSVNGAKPSRCTSRRYSPKGSSLSDKVSSFVRDQCFPDLVHLADQLHRAGHADAGWVGDPEA